ncbi:RNA-directed DNA polymerase, eukaryota [Tanacetum coccineum]|uniref:RNA-directed DNA polymerase, eukaryota n=1 Tax=Tanacetum coccineum TaxID=301880 RepID=A0ABQ5DKD6_9ASTR
MPDTDKVLSEDLFNLYDIINKRKDSGDDLKYPPGFTLSVINVEEANKKVKGATSNEVNEHVNSTSIKLEESVPKEKLSLNNSVCSKRVHTCGSILQFMDKLVKGNSSFDYALSSSLGNSGGILCVWEPTLFVKDNVTSSDNFLAVMGTWVPSSSKLLIISVYAPQDLTKKRVLWDYTLHLIHRWDGYCVIMGNFNKKKLQALKIIIKQWTKNAKKNSYKAKISIQSKLSDIDKTLDQGGSNEEILSDRSLLLKELNDINSINSLEAAQKSKVRWAIEGDENTKFFHGILNSKRSQLAICGTLVDGERIVDPLAVKTNLERNEEIKSAVWDCGKNKSPGPDGFTFEFFRRYWKLLKHDIVAAVKEFFASGLFSGIPIDSSFTLSHLFFADDAIFVGKWDSLNIRTIVNVLKCFHLASALKINFHKSKLIGIGTRPEEVDASTTTMGCSIFTTPFVHLGVKVGGAMSRIKS